MVQPTKGGSSGGPFSCILFFSPKFCLNKIRDGIFRIFVYPTMFVTVGGVTNQWREKGMTLQLDEKGRRGEGGLLLNYSISGDHPGLILYRDDEDVKLSKRFDRWCLFSIVCYVPFLGVLLGTD